MSRYDGNHRRARQVWATSVSRGETPCRRCGRAILPGQKWDLGHTEDGSPSQPEHASCNRAAGAAVTNELRRAREQGWAQPAVLEEVPADDPERGIFYGPPDSAGQPLRWSRAWFDWRPAV